MGQRTLHPHQGDAQSARGTPTTEGDHGLARAAHRAVRQRVGRHPKVHMLGVLPPGRQTEGRDHVIGIVPGKVFEMITQHCLK